MIVLPLETSLYCVIQRFRDKKVTNVHEYSSINSYYEHYLMGQSLNLRFIIFFLIFKILSLAI
jgi:hypothetical protein